MSEMNAAMPAPLERHELSICCDVTKFFSEVLIEMAMGRDSFSTEAFSSIIHTAKLIINIKIRRVTN